MKDVFNFTRLIGFLAKKSLHILLSLLGLGMLVSCKKSGYEKKNDAVYFKDYPIRSADYATFEGLNDVFGKDKHGGYYRGIPLSDSDGASFIALDDHYAKDKASVFFCDNYIDFKLFETRRKDKIVPIIGADAGSFVVIPNAYTYAKDNRRVYYKGEGFAVQDVASYQPLDYLFGRDKLAGYAQLKPIPGSHGPSFAVISAQFAVDKQHAYYAWSVVDGSARPGISVIKAADPASFTAVGLYYATDKTHAFYKDKSLEAADPASFKQWADSYTEYATDTTHVYYQDKRIARADRASFTVLADFYAQDKQTVFYGSDPLTGCDVATFQMLEHGYAKDNKRVYHDGKVLTGADPISFALVGNESDRDAADKTHSYYEGRRIKPGKN